jgi:uncharacterized phage protein (TIGR02218 family)
VTTFNEPVTTVTDQFNLVLTDSRDEPTNYYQAGILRSRSGTNLGVEREIKASTLIATNTQSVQLRLAFPYPVLVGDTFDLIGGCDRLFSTCHTKWNNTTNYRGEPHLPGSDFLVQTGRIPG